MPAAFLGLSMKFGLAEDFVAGEFADAAIVFVAFVAVLLAGFIDWFF